MLCVGRGLAGRTAPAASAASCRRSPRGPTSSGSCRSSTKRSAGRTCSSARSRRRGRGQHAGPGRFAAGRAGGGQGAVPGARTAADRRQSPAGPHLRLPPGRRARRLSLPGPDRQRRAHRASTAAARRSSSSCWAARSTTPPAKPSTKWPACWGCPFPADRPSSAPPSRATRRRSTCPRPLLGYRSARLQLQRPEDGGPLSHLPARAKPCPPSRSPEQVADLAASFQEAVVDCLLGKTSARALHRPG